MSWAPPGHWWSMSAAMFSRAGVPAGERRHLPDGVVGQHRDECAHVLVPERLHVAVEHRLELGGQVVLDGALGQLLLGELRVRPLERAVHRGHRGLQCGRGLLGRPAEHVAEDQHGSLARAGGAGGRRRTRAGSSRGCRPPGRGRCWRRRPSRRAPARARAPRWPRRARLRPGRRACRARSGAGGGSCSRGWSGTRWWRSGRARCAPRSGPRSRRTPARRAGRSPAPCPRRRRPTRSSGSSAR